MHAVQTHSMALGNKDVLAGFQFIPQRQSRIAFNASRLVESHQLFARGRLPRNGGQERI
jgi:hypothetical protein